MSKLRRQLSAGITNNVETRNLDDIKVKQVICMNQFLLLAKELTRSIFL